MLNDYYMQKLIMSRDIGISDTGAILVQVLWWISLILFMYYIIRTDSE